MNIAKLGTDEEFLALFAVSHAHELPAGKRTRLLRIASRYLAPDVAEACIATAAFIQEAEARQRELFTAAAEQIDGDNKTQTNPTQNP